MHGYVEWGIILKVSCAHLGYGCTCKIQKGICEIEKVVVDSLLGGKEV